MTDADKIAAWLAKNEPTRPPVTWETVANVLRHRDYSVVLGLPGCRVDGRPMSRAELLRRANDIRRRRGKRAWRDDEIQAAPEAEHVGVGWRRARIKANWHRSFIRGARRGTDKRRLLKGDALERFIRRAVYDDATPAELAREFGLTAQQASQQKSRWRKRIALSDPSVARTLHQKPRRADAWTDEENDLLRRLWPDVSVRRSDIDRQFPRRTPAAIAQQARGVLRLRREFAR